VAIDSAEAARRGLGKSKSLQLFDAERSTSRIRGGLAAQIAAFADHVRENVLRSAAHAGALVLYNELAQRAPEGETGNLKAAIYRKHLGSKSNATRQTYAIGVNKKKAPHWSNVEYGYTQIYVRFFSHDPANYGWRTDKTKRLKTPYRVPATPYLRPSWDAKGDAALQAMRERMRQRIAEYKAGGQ
jgi:hypothetical protein